MITYSLVAVIFFIGGIAFYKHRLYIKYVTEAKLQGLHDRIKSKL